MTKVLLIGDVHLTDPAHRPRSRTSSYTEQILDKLRFCVRTANENGAAIVQAGDRFHIKPPSKNSHALVQEIHTIFEGCHRGVWIVPGNHDMRHDRLDSLDSQPLGSLCRMDGVRLLLGYDPDLPGIMGVPYLTEFDDGGDWERAIQNFWERYAAYEPTDSEYNNLIVTHAPIFPPGQAPGVYASIDPKQWADFWSHDGPINTYYGHIHDSHSTFMVEGHTFCNQGALSRGSLHEATINRKPAVTLWDGSEFTRIEVPHSPPEEVFLFEQATIKTANKASAAEFAAALGQTTIEGLTIDSVLAMLRAEVKDKTVLDILIDAIEGAE